jgi:phosphate transport system protein
MTRVFEPVLIDLRETVLRMASRAEAILEKSLRSAWERDSQLAQQVSTDDLEIDRLDVEAVDMILIAKSLERVGDHATNIAEDVILVCEARNVKHAAKLGR